MAIEDTIRSTAPKIKNSPGIWGFMRVIISTRTPPIPADMNTHRLPVKYQTSADIQAF